MLVPMPLPRIWCIRVSMNLKVLCLRIKSSMMCVICRKVDSLRVVDACIST